MRGCSFPPIVGCLLAAGLYATPAAPQAQSIIEADRNFSRLSSEEGIRESFMTFLSDSGVIFRPAPVNGREWYAGRARTPGLILMWEPEFAEVSKDRDFGYTTGPWILTSLGVGDTTRTFGTYVSVWRRNAAGEWKVDADLGVAHAVPKPKSLYDVRSPIYHRSAPAPDPGVERGIESLLDADRELSRQSLKLGMASAYRGIVADPFLLLREGLTPDDDADMTWVVLANWTGRVSWTPVGGGIAGSRDLGYTFGSVERDGALNSHYLRIWRREGSPEWRLALDIFVPASD